VRSAREGPLSAGGTRSRRWLAGLGGRRRGPAPGAAAADRPDISSARRCD